MPKTFIRGEFRGQTHMDEALKAGDETEARFIELLKAEVTRLMNQKIWIIALIS